MHDRFGERIGDDSTDVNEWLRLHPDAYPMLEREARGLLGLRASGTIGGRVAQLALAQAVNRLARREMLAVGGIAE